MLGNVWECCRDGYDAEYYEKSPPADPPGAAEARGRVIRGGSWINFPRSCRPAFRDRYGPEGRISSLGFRVAVIQAGAE
jgi:formylglycine-generating enzyme required for sulfatase activity